MKRVFILKGLDCPNCSAKIEKEVGELGGVASSTVNLMNQTLTVQAGTSVATSLLDTVTTIVHSHEPDVEVSEKTEPAVTKVYLLKGLDCPNCSAKIEKEVGELDGVTSSTVNLMNQTLTVQAGTSVAASLLDTVTTIVHSHEPDVEVSEKQLEATAPVKKDEKAAVYNDEDKKRTIRLAVGAVVYAIGMALTVFAKLPTLAELAFLIVAYVILGWDVVWQAVKNITRGQVFDEHFLMSVSTIGAFAIGEYPEAVAVMLFYQVGEFFQSLAVKRSRKSISDLMDIRPDSATVKRNGVLQVVSPESVAVGEIIVVKPGEKIPLDGIVVDGESMLDTKALTGESVPRSIRKGDEALSGCINQSGLLTLKVTKSFGESTVSKITDLVENASARKAPTENFITTFARYYTPVVVGMAAVLAIIPPLVLGGGWSEWLRRGFVFLIVSCPCALVISIPLTFFGGIGAASKRGVLVKGSNYLEALNKVSVVVFDKTGTLTKGVFEVANIIPAAGYQKEQVLEYAAQAESYSNHPIAKSILATYGKPIDQKQFSGFEEISGHGISVMVQGKKVLAGNSKLMESEKIAYAACDAAGTKFYVAADGSYVGCILIADEVKPDSKCAIAELKKIGVEKTVMLTGDDERIGKSVADELGLDYLSGISGTYVELFPEMAKSEYRNLWIDAATPLVGEDNAESATDMLLGMCMAEPYGEEAVEKYAADPDSTAFNCYFLGGVEKFVMNGDTITGLDAQGQEVFAHTYQKLDVDNENSFLFYQSEDADSGEFTYFAFAPDTMETTYHLEFRYAEDLDDLQSWYEGNYAYWNAAAIAEDYDQATMENVIELFVTENLSEAE